MVFARRVAYANCCYFSHVVAHFHLQPIINSALLLCSGAEGIDPLPAVRSNSIGCSFYLDNDFKKPYIVC